MSDALVSLVTALADDELVLGHRHSEWTGFAPHLEEDVAFSSIAQDEIGHAANYYALLGSITGRDPDDVALGRAAQEYRHATICERPNRDWAYTLARHWVYDHADEIRLPVLEQSASEELAALATKIRREERYHLLHADTWMRRVAQGPVEGRSKLIDALGETYGDAFGLFEPFELEEEAVKEGWLPAPSGVLQERFVAESAAALDALGLPGDLHLRLEESAEFVASSSGDLISGEGQALVEVSRHEATGGRAGRHTEHFDALWDEMTYTYRHHPGATW